MGLFLYFSHLEVWQRHHFHSNKHWKITQSSRIHNKHTRTQISSERWASKQWVYKFPTNFIGNYRQELKHLSFLIKRLRIESTNQKLTGIWKCFSRCLKWMSERVYKTQCFIGMMNNKFSMSSIQNINSFIRFIRSLCVREHSSCSKRWIN